MPAPEKKSKFERLFMKHTSLLYSTPSFSSPLWAQGFLTMLVLFLPVVTATCARLTSFACEDKTCSGKSTHFQGPWPVDGTCCTMCGDDPSEPCDWSTAYYPQNKTLVQYSNSPAADPHCARFQEGTAMWSDECVPFEIPGVMCANMKVVVTDENCECPKHASHLSADRWGQIATSLVV